MQVRITKNGIRSMPFDPRTKIFALLIVEVILLSGGFEPPILYIKYITAFVPIILLFLSHKKRSAIILAVLFLLAANSNILFNSYLSMASVGGVFVQLAVAIITVIVPSVSMGYYLISSTYVSEFIAAMEKLHVSQKIIIPFVVMFRFFPTIAEEYHAIQDAMKMRGIHFSKNVIAALEYRLVPLLISIVKIGEDLSAAAITRGLGLKNKRTNVCEIGFKFPDFILFFTAIVLFGFYCAGKAGIL